MGDGRCRCCCISYRTRVTLFAFTNVFLAGVQLILPLISSGFILYFTGSKKEFEAKYVLHHETISLFERIPKIVLRPPDSSQISVEYVGMPHSQLQSDLHVWSSWIFMKVVILVYSALLYTGARKKSYGLVLSWFALQVPLTLHSLLLLGMDFGLGLMRMKPLKFQVFQAALAGYNLLGLLFVFFYLRGLRRGRGVARLGGGGRRGEHSESGGGKFRDPASLHFMYGPPRRDFEVDERYFYEYEV